METLSTIMEWLAQANTSNLAYVFVIMAWLIGLVQIFKMTRTLRTAERSTKFLLAEAAKGVARESTALKAIHELDPEIYKAVVNEFRSDPLRPNELFVELVAHMRARVTAAQEAAEAKKESAHA